MDGWTDVEVDDWLRANGFGLIPEQHGGLGLTVTARDPGAAVDRAIETVDTYRSTCRHRHTVDFAQPDRSRLCSRN